MDTEPRTEDEQLPEGYEPPQAEDLDTSQGPSVTAAGKGSVVVG